MNGLESDPNYNKKLRVTPSFSGDIIEYLAIDSFGLDNPRLQYCLTIGAKFNGNGFYIRRDNFLEKLPIFAASQYPDHCNEWKVMSFIMKTANKAKQYLADVKSSVLDKFLFKTMFWTSLSHYLHLRTLNGSDGQLYLNELCFDDNSLATKTMKDSKNIGYDLTDTEKELLYEFNEILRFVKTTNEYNIISLQYKW